MNDSCCTIFQALSDRTRLTILELLKEKERCVSELCEHFQISQPSVSHHLDILKRSGLVSADKRGREVFYTFNDNVLIECCGQQFKLFDLVVRRNENKSPST
jgi:DNA-binding transcriptional ArsR family regulator